MLCVYKAHEEKAHHEQDEGEISKHKARMKTTPRATFKKQSEENVMGEGRKIKRI
jgi:hypothetical protein